MEQISNVLQPKSNARIAMLSNYFPVRDIVHVKLGDKQFIDLADIQVWKGTLIADIIRQNPTDDGEKIVYFRRIADDTPYDQLNEWELFYPEIHFTNLDILGYEFWLIPKDKMLFGWEPPSAILKVPVSISTRRGVRL